MRIESRAFIQQPAFVRFQLPDFGHKFRYMSAMIGKRLPILSRRLDALFFQAFDFCVRTFLGKFDIKFRFKFFRHFVDPFCFATVNAAFFRVTASDPLEFPPLISRSECITRQ